MERRRQRILERIGRTLELRERTSLVRAHLLRGALVDVDVQAKEQGRAKRRGRTIGLGANFKVRGASLRLAGTKKEGTPKQA